MHLLRQVRREGLFYSFKYFVQQTIHSNILFFDVNRKAIIKSKQQIPFYYGISITRYTTLSQLRYFIDKMPDDSGAIFIFHSILSSDEPGYGADKWYWDKEAFDGLCKFLTKNNRTTVVTNEALFWEFVLSWKRRGVKYLDLMGYREYKMKYNPVVIEIPRIIFEKIPGIFWGKEVTSHAIGFFRGLKGLLKTCKKRKKNEY